MAEVASMRSTTSSLTCGVSMVGDCLSIASPATLTLSSGRSRPVKYCSQVLAYPARSRAALTQPTRRYLGRTLLW
jgi:hypothetical protein